MKPKLTKGQLLGSLAFPVGIIIWAAYQYIRWSMMFGDQSAQFIYQWSCLIAGGVCGVLPIILILALKIDTSEQFLPRLLIFLSTIAVISITREFIDYQIMFTGRLVLLLAAVVFSALFFYRIRPVKFSVWIMLFLSDPCLVYFVCYMTQMRDLNVLIERYNISLM